MEIEAILEKRRQVWDRIQTEAPEIAQSMKAIADVFGRPKAVQVWIGDERVI